MINEKVFNFG